MSSIPCQNPALMGLFHSDDETEQREAAAKCFDCPLMLKCGSDGTNEPYGVWGGTTPDDRPEAVAAEVKRLAAAEAAAVKADESRLERMLMDDTVTNAEIARLYSISTKTVSNRRTRLKNTLHTVNAA